MILIKRFLGKTTSDNDHYMINMGSQRPKIGSTWPLNSPYLQHCINNVVLILKHLNSNFIPIYILKLTK